MKIPAWQVFALAGAIVFGTLQIAQANSSSSTLTACVKKSGGSMRLVANNAKCTTAERKVTWNSRGVAGPQGPQGVAGPAGGSAVNSVLLSAGDFFPHGVDADESVALDTHLINQQRYPAWLLPDSRQDRTTISTSVPVPAQWRSATSITVTVYYSTSVGGGTVAAGLEYAGSVADSTLRQSWQDQAAFNSQPTGSHVIVERSVTLPLLGNSDFVQIGFLRNNMPDTDTNNGNLYFYGMRLTPNF